MARLVPISELRSKSISPKSKLLRLEIPKNPNASHFLNPASFSSRTTQGKSMRELSSILSNKYKPSQPTGLDLEKTIQKLKFRSPRLLKKVTLVENVEMHNEKSEVTIQDVHSALNAIKKMALADPLNNEELMQINRVLTLASMIPRVRLNNAILMELINKYTEVAGSSEAVPYFCVCDVLLNFIVSKTKDNEKLVENLKNLRERYENEVKQLKSEKRATETVFEGFIEALKPEREHFETAKEELMSSRSKLESVVAKLAHKDTELRDARRALNKDNETIINLTQKLKEVKEEVAMLMTFNQKLQEEVIQQRQFHQNLGDDFSTALKRLKLSRHENVMLTGELRDKEHMVRDLTVRAAVAFDEMTPRPALGELLEVLNVSVEERASTIEKCSMILEAATQLKNKKKSKRISSPRLKANYGTQAGDNTC